MSSPQDRFAGEPPPGTRDTGSDEPSGGEDRPSGPYKGDESVPIHSDEDDPGFGTKFTNEHPTCRAGRTSVRRSQDRSRSGII